MFYLASGCKEKVEEGFESRVTQWNPRKYVRVHEMHVRASSRAQMDVREHGHAREGAQCAVGRAGGRSKDIGSRALARTCGRRGHTDVHVHASQGDVRDVQV
ncbi:hypothetical protein CRG98_009110 [Punica granatum]|uniref:Uncharacterized protein n=1 Tax=Punica granatum TaxID=22663 RepID=A0A2I0KQ22_PUNGR|nr:hypothetical protein CRG98_009110 [Punica granatum]